MFNLASKYDNTYRERDCFNIEIGNSPFLIHRYKLSSCFFMKGYSKSKKTEHLFFLADSELFSGKYKEANHHFKEVLKDDQNTFYYSEAILKELFSRFLYENCIDEQTRNIDDAWKVIKNNEHDFEILCEGLEHDCLNMIIWFNLGIYYSLEENYQLAFLSFTFCTILANDDYESYVNAIISFINIINDYPEGWCYFSALLRNGYSHNENEFELEILTLLNEKTQDKEIVDLFCDIFEDIKKQKPNKGHTLRFISENGDFDVVEIDEF